MGLRIRFNARQLEANLDQIGARAMENGSRSLRRIADRMEQLAKEYAPVDDGDLENAIKQAPPKRDGNRRMTYAVFIDGDMPAKVDGDGMVTKTVGDYALLQEKYLTPRGRWKLGKRSRAKAATGKKVGGAFFERAAKEAAERAVQDVGDAVRASLRSKYSGALGGVIMSRSDYRARQDGGDDE